MLTRNYIINLCVDESNLEGLMLAYVQLDGIIEGFKKNGFPVQDYLMEKFNEIKMELDIRIKSDKLRKLKILKAQRETLKTRDELRTQKDAEITALEKELNS